MRMASTMRSSFYLQEPKDRAGIWCGCQQHKCSPVRVHLGPLSPPITHNPRAWNQSCFSARTLCSPCTLDIADGLLLRITTARMTPAESMYSCRKK